MLPVLLCLFVTVSHRRCRRPISCSPLIKSRCLLVAMQAGVSYYFEVRKKCLFVLGKNASHPVQSRAVVDSCKHKCKHVPHLLST